MSGRGSRQRRREARAGLGVRETRHGWSAEFLSVKSILDSVARLQAKRQEVTAEEQAHMRAARRAHRLRSLAGAVTLTGAEFAELARLRRLRGKAARRLTRRRREQPVGLLKSGDRKPAPLRLNGNRIPRAARVLLLNEEGRAITGRQWKKLRKAARRQERAA